MLLDFTRWLKVADDVQGELHISVGCTLENLLIAAQYFGLGYDCVLLPEADDPSIAGTITFREKDRPGSHRTNDLFDIVSVIRDNYKLSQSAVFYTCKNEDFDGSSTMSELPLLRS